MADVAGSQFTLDVVDVVLPGAVGVVYVVFSWTGRYVAGSSHIVRLNCRVFAVAAGSVRAICPSVSALPDTSIVFARRVSACLPPTAALR
ncbi:MAG: hypothetical protein ACRDV4_02600 [Acidimicrobiales bacterium]